VSKAFTSEETPDEPALVAPRAPLPAGVTNFVTARGLDLLRTEQRSLIAERAGIEALGEGEARTRALAVWSQRVTDLEQRLASATLVDAAAQPKHEVRFGAHVVVRGEGGPERHYQIVGVDEADAAQGRIAFVSPLARALLGSKVGDSALVRTPRGEEELEICAIRYASAAPETAAQGEAPHATQPGDGDIVGGAGGVQRAR
jgi:transcription elongation factor GreB